MCTIEKEIEKYLSEIQNYLVCDRKTKKHITREIEGLVYDYAEAKVINDISEIYEHFGTPEEMARTYLSQVDPKKIVKAVKIKKAIIIAIIVAVFIFAIYLVSAYVDGHKNSIGYVERDSLETSLDIIEESPMETNIGILE